MTALLADDMTGVGIADDPIAVACFVAAGVAETAIIVVTTADALKKLYHVYMAEHTKNPTPSNRDKHTKRRAGKTYGKVKNQNRGDKNKKYEHPVNPNKKRK